VEEQSASVSTSSTESTAAGALGFCIGGAGLESPMRQLGVVVVRSSACSLHGLERNRYG